MKKTDSAIKKITIASIKRRTISPFDFKYSTIYQEDETILNEGIKDQINLVEGEALICSTIVSESVWSVVTTCRIITLEGIRKVEHHLVGLKKTDLGDFKGYSKQEYTKGFLHFNDDSIIPYFIETGKAAMLMIYGVETTAQLL